MTDLEKKLRQKIPNLVAYTAVKTDAEWQHKLEVNIGGDVKTFSISQPWDMSEADALNELVKMARVAKRDPRRYHRP